MLNSSRRRAAGELCRNAKVPLSGSIGQIEHFVGDIPFADSYCLHGEEGSAWGKRVADDSALGERSAAWKQAWPEAERELGSESCVAAAARVMDSGAYHAEVVRGLAGSP